MRYNFSWEGTGDAFHQIENFEQWENIYYWISIWINSAYSRKRIKKIIIILHFDRCRITYQWWRRNHVRTLVNNSMKYNQNKHNRRVPGQSVQISNNRINNLLSGADSAEIFRPVLAFWDHTFHGCFKSISKWRKLEMPQHHSWWQ